MWLNVLYYQLHSGEPSRFLCPSPWHCGVYSTVCPKRWLRISPKMYTEYRNCGSQTSKRRRNRWLYKTWKSSKYSVISLTALQFPKCLKTVILTPVAWWPCGISVGRDPSPGVGLKPNAHWLSEKLCDNSTNATSWFSLQTIWACWD